MTYVFIAIGLIIGFLQYGLLKTFLSYMKASKGAAGVAAIKAILYVLVAAVLYIWFKDMWLYCLSGVAAGILLTALLDAFRKGTK